MVRRNRIWFPGATYHITARGNRKENLFQDNEDYNKYLSLLKETKETYPFLLHSYCLMNNHIHLQLETGETSISQIMAMLHTKYAIYYNKRHSLVGHVFQGRFGSKLILSTNYFLTVNRYIHRNPLEANLVINPEDYKWSSYRTYINTPTKNTLVTTTKTLSFFTNSDMQAYKRFIEEETDSPYMIQKKELK
ncbi:transposase [Metabacillus malikii]|uniref:REP element-mobilizing transposase RayT n=1 Tax=Metabacillus malikii TaxID=1504265 RepID=A0ABT9ZL61_9BACI|nr:transposase [Metabacillus malikii]MDQ0232725.1 REP element-mobilizing transposase RayT [Metabacillus malikii]